MKPLNDMTADDILEEDVFMELFDMQDQVKRTRTEIALKTRSRELGVAQDFKELLAAYKRADKEMKQKKQQENQMCTLDNYTNFQGPYDELACGAWIAKLNGIYSQSNLQMAKDLGYETFFWSLAYVDWYQDNQPTKEQAFDKLLKRIHPGAIVLLHSTSSTNAQILDELLTRWEEMGYTFKPLSEVVS